MDKKFKNILITGGSGFLGSHTADHLFTKGYKVTIFDKIPSKYTNKNIKYVSGDINDYKLLEKNLKNIDAVFHFAAEADISKASKYPSKTIQTNILATSNLLELSVKNKVKKFIFGSSVYTNSNFGGIYATTKITSELLIKNYYEIYKLNYVILRYGSLYGTRSNNFNFIYKLIENAFISGELVREGDGEELRDYIFVEDAAEITAKSLENKINNETILVTGNQKIKIKELLLLIKEVLNNQPKIRYIKKNNLYHYKTTPYSFRPDYSKKIDLSKKTELAEGLLHTIYEVYDQLKNKKTKFKI